MKKLQEGKAIFRANISGKNKGPGKAAGVFYNPAMKFSRDLHVAFARQFNFKGIMLDGLAASGIRGIRLFLEAGVNIEFCDVSRLATDTIQENMKLNKMSCRVHNKTLEELLKDRKYDWIDIDPFGTPVPYLKAAIDSLNKKGILGVSATDTAVLFGAKPTVCERRYGSKSMKKVASKEIGTRILISKIYKIASESGKGIQPLLSYYEGHHLRVFLRITEKRTVQLKWIDKNMKIRDKKNDDTSGPLWVDKIIQADLVPSDCSGLLGKFFDKLRKEADGPPGLYDINEIAKDANVGQTPKRKKIVKCISNLGCFASSSVFSPLGIKTDASRNDRIEAVKHAQSL